MGSQLTERSAQVEEASVALQKLETENKKFLETIQRQELALRLERERLRWPQLLAELKRHSQKGLWITRLQTTSPTPGSAVAAPGEKPAEAAGVMVEIGGMFETRSEKADAEAVANFQKALGTGGVLSSVEVVERETPQYVDGKTDQVALKFRLRAKWPQEPPAPPSAPGVRR